MQIKDIENLADLARINLTDEEKNSLLSDMEAILDYVKQVTDIQIPEDFKNFTEKEDPYFVYNIWREDEEYKKDFSLDLIRKQFPDFKDNFVKVKKIL